MIFSICLLFTIFDRGLIIGECQLTIKLGRGLSTKSPDWKTDCPQFNLVVPYLYLTTEITGLDDRLPPVKPSCTLCVPYC